MRMTGCSLMCGMMAMIPLLLVPATVRGQKIYWVDRGAEKIQRANLDGSDVEDVLVADPADPTGVAIDSSTGTLYWTDRNEIRRARIDGSNVQTLLVLGAARPGDIALDIDAGKMYWTESTRVADGWSGAVSRANLDGSNKESILIYSRNAPSALALDCKGGKVYWSGSNFTTINRANLDGSDVEYLFGTTEARGLALDLDAGTMYWTNSVTDSLYRARLDGTETERLDISDVSVPWGIAFDPVQKKIYWANNDYTGPLASVRRANPDGTGAENLGVSGVKWPTGVAVDSAHGKVYWADWYTNSIRRAALDGSQAEDILASEFIEPFNLALDVTSGHLFWSEFDRIQRSRLDGTNVETVVTATAGFRPQAIAVAPALQKIYWIDRAGRSIGRANYDGTQEEVLLVADTLPYPEGLALDLVAGFLFWFYDGFNKMGRARLDGSDAERLSCTVHPLDLVLDPHTETMYWTHRPYGAPYGSGMILRSGYQGDCGRRILACDDCPPRAIALDSGSGRIYWSTVPVISAGTIRRSSMDGAYTEEIVSGPNAWDIALDLRPSLSVPLDIRPRGCPNMLNLSSQGKVPIAVVGTDSFNVADIDTSTIELRRADGVGTAVKPLAKRSGRTGVPEEVATPFGGHMCECHDLGGDGIADQVFHFSTSAMVREFDLGHRKSGDVVQLTVTGFLFDRREFSASDCITIVGQAARHRQPSRHEP